jgi:hypothetical protein
LRGIEPLWLALAPHPDLPDELLGEEPLERLEEPLDVPDPLLLEPLPEDEPLRAIGPDHAEGDLPGLM